MTGFEDLKDVSLDRIHSIVSWMDAWMAPIQRAGIQACYLLWEGLIEAIQKNWFWSAHSGHNKS